VSAAVLAGVRLASGRRVASVEREFRPVEAHEPAEDTPALPPGDGGSRFRRRGWHTAHEFGDGRGGGQLVAVHDVPFFRDRLTGARKATPPESDL